MQWPINRLSCSLANYVCIDCRRSQVHGIYISPPGWGLNFYVSRRFSDDLILFYFFQFGATLNAIGKTTSDEPGWEPAIDTMVFVLGLACWLLFCQSNNSDNSAGCLGRLAYSTPPQGRGPHNYVAHKEGNSPLRVLQGQSNGHVWMFATYPKLVVSRMVGRSMSLAPHQDIIYIHWVRQRSDFVRTNILDEVTQNP